MQHVIADVCHKDLRQPLHLHGVLLLDFANADCRRLRAVSSASRWNLVKKSTVYLSVESEQKRQSMVGGMLQIQGCICC